ncbi:ATP-binding protein [Halanaerocella petrolearia]
MSHFNKLNLKLDQLVIYRDLLEDDLIKKFRKLISEDTTKNYHQKTKLFHQICHQLINHTTNRKLEGNLWHNYLSYLITTSQNSFSLTSEEIKTNFNTSNSLYQAALHDIKILQHLYQFDLTSIANQLRFDSLKFINNFQTTNNNPSSSYYSKRIQQLSKAFLETKDRKKLTNKIINHYSQGAGKLGLFYSFRWSSEGLVPIKYPDPVNFSDLIGYQKQQEKLVNNTKRLLQNQPTNNILLYGAKGTGKSSSIKALLNKYKEQGVRLIEITKDQIKELPNILDFLNSRGLYFIIFLDDLSFADFETDYKYLKAVLEGRMTVKPDNILFYATSNRRHLIKESWADRNEETGEVHTSDALEEKLSLADRFGIKIRYDSPNQNDYLEIVTELAKRHDISLPKEDIEKRAKQWAMWQNSRSGRTAQQFINHLLGEFNM